MTTSVTKELNNQDSPLYQWFMSKMSQGGYKIIHHHNDIMAKQWNSIIAPPSSYIDYCLVGMAITYAMRYYYQNLDLSIHLTAAGIGASKLNMLDKVRELIEKSSDYQELCILFILLAVLDSYGRGYEHALLEFINPKGAYLLGDEFYHRYQETLEDVGNLAIVIPRLLPSIHNGDVSIVHPNPTFLGSAHIHADAQMVVDGILLDIRTTAKRRPFSIVNLFQQVCYILMDWDNEYQINSLGWIYSRQQNIFHYPIDKIFKDLPSLRREFRSFLNQQYPEPHLIKAYKEFDLLSDDDYLTLPD